MLKKVLVSVGLGVLLLFSLTLWAQNNQAPIMVASLEVENQLSISALQLGEDRFIGQVGPKKVVTVASKKDLPAPLLSSFGVIAFGLIYFVIRSSRQRVSN